MGVWGAGLRPAPQTPIPTKPTVEEGGAMRGKPPTTKQLHDAYALARERHASLGVDTDQALAALGQIALSLHCWQGDDVGGFESPGTPLSGGIAATGSYPGKARNADELRRDLDRAYSLIPGVHRLNLHAIYAE